jgi:hypothetical protein
MAVWQASTCIDHRNSCTGRKWSGDVFCFSLEAVGMAVRSYDEPRQVRCTCAMIGQTLAAGELAAPMPASVVMQPFLRSNSYTLRHCYWTATAGAPALAL